MSKLPRCYEPELNTTDENRQLLWDIYMESWPWHGTDEASSYDYPGFIEAVMIWAEDEFYIQHFLAKVYLRSLSENTK